jgi:amidohydrolase
MIGQTAAAPLAEPPADPRIAIRLAELRDDLVSFRRDLHRHPELSGQEERTARIVADRLRRLGLEVRTGVGGHGVVALLQGGRPGPVVGYRADMDAVPSVAPDPVAFASETPGVRHICGHDIHTTVAVGVAEALAAVREELPGTVLFLFQPAEENATGARAMIADGALEEPTPEALFAVHTAPLPVGQIGASEGPTLAGRDLAEIVLTGDGDLEAAAQRVASVIAAASTVEVPSSIVELALMPLTDDLAAATVVESGPGPTPDSWRMLAVVSFATEQSRLEAKERIASGLGRLDLGEVEHHLEHHDRWVSGVFSDPELVRTTYPAIRAAIGDDGLVVSGGVGPAFSEDFGFFLDHAPGAMYWLGVANPERGTTGMPHAPDYVADEDAIQIGARAMASVLLDYLVRHAPRE